MKERFVLTTQDKKRIVFQTEETMRGFIIKLGLQAEKMERQVEEEEDHWKTVENLA